MTKLDCAKCEAPFALGLPLLIEDVWYARCPVCGVENELAPVFGRPGEPPAFRVVRVRETPDIEDSGTP